MQRMDSPTPLPHTIKIDDSIVLTVSPIEDDTYMEPVFRLDVTVEREGLKVTFGNSVNGVECDQLVASLASAMAEAKRRFDAAEGA
jgi:hypothetical protein